MMKQQAAALLRGVEDLADKRRAEQIVLRHSRPMPTVSWAQSMDKVSMVLQLPDSVAELQKKLVAFSRSACRSARIRKCGSVVQSCSRTFTRCFVA